MNYDDRGIYLRELFLLLFLLTKFENKEMVVKTYTTS
jgi:hypothetical protein